MRKRINHDTQVEARLLTTAEACDYLSQGRTRMQDFCNEIGATRRFGRSVRYDRNVIDRAIDAMGVDQ